MEFKLLILIGSADFRLEFAKRVAQEAAKTGGRAGIACIGNSLYGLRRGSCQPVEGFEGVELMVHETSMIERGIQRSELISDAKPINDDELLELMITSGRTLCI